MKELLRPIAAIALSALVLLGAAAALRPVAERNRAAEREAMMARLLPGGSGFVPEEYTGEDENIRAVYGMDAAVEQFDGIPMVIPHFHAHSSPY